MLDQITAPSNFKPCKDLRGVDRWLLLLCIFLAFVWPISSGVAAITILRSIPLSLVSLEAQLLPTVVMFASVGFGVYSFIVGMSFGCVAPGLRDLSEFF